ncbi:MAG: glycoside hydrolase family 2 protein [Opitutaceae bacterium]
MKQVGYMADTKRSSESSQSNDSKNQRIVSDLSGFLWKLEGCLPGRGLEQKFPEISHDHMGDTLNWSWAHIPGDVFTDLWRVGRIEDPHYGRNSIKAKWVNEYEWWYLRFFNVPEEMEGKRIEICFEGVDYACDVFVNGKEMGSHEGMFTPFAYDITDLVSFEQMPRGRNLLAVRLHPAPRRYSQVAGKKPAWHGDYWTSIVPTGIWKPVRLEAFDAAKIEDVYVQPKLSETGSADVEIHVEVEDFGSLEQTVAIQVEVQGENFESDVFSQSIQVSLNPGLNTFKVSLPIEDAQLWYPWDLGDQNLYIANVSINRGEGALMDAHSEVFGIRELKMEMNPGFTKEEVENPWTVMINGKRHFLRSGTWGGPPDIFFGRATNDKYEALVRMAKEANLNNLRIFGWHPTEIPYFYELCNRAGITVWQDILPIASLSLPKDPKFKEGLFEDAISVVKQLRNHPCMTIIEGGEEILMTASGPVHNLKIMQELGEVVKPYSNLHYIPVSPLSDEVAVELGYKPKESVHANGQFYGEGRKTMESYFPELDFAAVSELAISSCPNVESIRKFIPPGELWPPGPSWGHHWTDFDVLRTFNFEVVGTQSTESMEAFVEASQLSQGAIFQFGLEYFRRRKPRSSATCICHYITFAPDMKWGIVDYFQQTKKSYDFVRLAYQPLLVSLEYSKRRWLPDEEFQGKLWVVNDFYKAFKSCTTIVTVRNQKKEVVCIETVHLGDIEPDSSKALGALCFKVRGQLGEQFFIDIEMSDESGEVVSENHYLLLIADEKVDLPELKRIGAEAIDKRVEYGSSNYLRYFEGFTNEHGEPHWGETLPVVKEFRT